MDRPLLWRGSQRLIALTEKISSGHMLEPPGHEPHPLGQRGIGLRCETFESGRSVGLGEIEEESSPRRRCGDAVARARLRNREAGLESFVAPCRTTARFVHGFAVHRNDRGDEDEVTNL